MDETLKDLEEAQELIKGILQNTIIESNKWRNEEANRLKDCVDRAYNKVQNMADNLKEE